MKNSFIESVNHKHASAVRYLACAKHALILVIRLWIAHVFWVSGLLKVEDFSTTVLLFTNEHPVPYVPPVVAAAFSTIFELGCPVLLALGLGARLATLPLLLITAVMQFTYENATEHYYWAMLLCTILVYGPEKISLDYWISKKINP